MFLEPVCIILWTSCGTRQMTNQGSGHMNDEVIHAYLASYTNEKWLTIICDLNFVHTDVCRMVMFTKRLI